MKFQPGDRVVLIRDFDELKSGDAGVFLHEVRSFPELGVRWDKGESYMHSCDGSCEVGHGWYVPHGHLTFEKDIDLGELPEVGLAYAENFLFSL